jgi:hypothetical protein
MPRRRRALDGIRFKRFQAEQHEAFKLFLQLPGMKDVFDSVARDGHRTDGRGLVTWISVDGTVAGLREPIFVSASSWRRMPLLVNTPHPDLLQALTSYDRQASYIILVAGTVSETMGMYTWWIEPFRPAPKPLRIEEN